MKNLVYVKQVPYRNISIFQKLPWIKCSVIKKFLQSLNIVPVHDAAQFPVFN